MITEEGGRGFQIQSRGGIGFDYRCYTEENLSVIPCPQTILIYFFLFPKFTCITTLT